MQIGIVGLPNAGKSTLFNALTRGNALAQSYPFSTVDPNLGKVALPDPYLGGLQEVFGAGKKTPVGVEFVDIAGLVEGAHKGEGLGNKFLDRIRKVEAIVHVIRAFSASDVARVNPEGDPMSDYKIIERELVQADLESIARRKEKTSPMLKTGQQRYKDELACLEKGENHINLGKPIRSMERSQLEDQILGELHLLTEKPVLHVLNGPDEGENINFRKEMEKNGLKVILVDAKMEEELGQLDPEEAQEMRREMEIESALDQLVSMAYGMLDLIKYYTGNENEVRARNIITGSTLLEGATQVHQDIAAGFIKGEVISAPDLLQAGSWNRAREEGKIRAEGREYVIRPDDVVYIHFR